MASTERSMGTVKMNNKWFVLMCLSRVAFSCSGVFPSLTADDYYTHLMEVLEEVRTKIPKVFVNLVQLGYILQVHHETLLHPTHFTAIPTFSYLSIFSLSHIKWFYFPQTNDHCIPFDYSFSLYTSVLLFVSAITTLLGDPSHLSHRVRLCLSIGNRGRQTKVCRDMVCVGMCVCDVCCVSVHVYVCVHMRMYVK